MTNNLLPEQYRLRDEQVQQLLTALQERWLVLTEMEDGMTYIQPPSEIALPADLADPTVLAVPAEPVAPASQQDKNMAFLVLIVKDRARRTPRRLSQLRAVADTIPLRTVLALL